MSQVIGPDWVHPRHDEAIRVYNETCAAVRESLLTATETIQAIVDEIAVPIPASAAPPVEKFGSKKAVVA